MAEATHRVDQVWRVNTTSGATYWVISNPTGSYDATHLDASQALYMHVGINVVLFEQMGPPNPYTW